VIQTDAYRARRGVIAVFFACGLVTSALASRMWVVRELLDASPARMGVLLLFTSFGSMCVMPLVGPLVSRRGTRTIVRIGSVVGIVGLIAAVVCVVNGWQAATAAALFVMGSGIGTWDVTMNLAGTDVEHGMGRAVMPQFHAGFSLGTVASAGLGVICSRVGAPLEANIGISLVMVVVLLAYGTRTFLTHGVLESSEPARAQAAPQRFTAWSAWRERRTLMIGFLVLGVSLAEGSANDWLILGIGQDFKVPESIGIVGLGCFLTAMTSMRALGTKVIDARGRVFTHLICASSALVGLAVYCLSPWVGLALIGAVFWGFGAAMGFPMGMSSAADDPRRAALRTSVVSTIGYTAFLAGPPLLGILADHVGYRHALLVVMIPVVIGMALAPALRPLTAARKDVG
jgi:MFS family permease